MSSRGFTLLEVLVAIFMMTAGAGGVFILANQAQATLQINSSKLVASYLAQEGVERKRNIRDANFIKIYQGVPNVNWDDNLPAGSESDVVDIFRRSVRVSDKTATSLKVLAEVSWSERGRTHQVFAQEILYNWWEKQ